MKPNGSQPNDSVQTMESAPNGMKASHQSIVVKASPAEVYERWLRFEDLPQFITPLRDVQRINDTSFSFTTSRDGREERSVIHVVLRVPERRIAWRAISEEVGVGVVSFEPRSEKATEVTLKLHSVFDPTTSSKLAAEYLGNFKRLVEKQELAV
jgi:uncharacterized membrane protein